MAMHAFLLLALLLGDPSPQPTASKPDALPPAESDLLVSTHEALADVDKLCVVVITHGARQTESMMDYPRLQEQAIEKVRAEGIQHFECKTGLTPRLHIHVETVRLEDCGRCVYRVQTALTRIVTFSNHRQRQIQADVWRVNPVMQVVADAQLAEAVTTSVLAQVEAFAGAYQVARRLGSRAETTPPEPSDPETVSRQDLKDAAEQALASYDLVASKRSTVFHRSTCPSAGRIAPDNRVGYGSREEAIAAGKTPCKLCKP